VEARPGDRLEWWAGSPYRGLQAFDLEHAAVFFGRERAQREITEALVRRSSEGPAFMLVLGASGSGKSSLVRAGIVPDLMAPGVVSGVSTWRHVVVQPGDLAPDPFAALTALLIRSKALPEAQVSALHKSIEAAEKSPESAGKRAKLQAMAAQLEASAATASNPADSSRNLYVTSAGESGKGARSCRPGRAAPQSEHLESPRSLHLRD